MKKIWSVCLGILLSYSVAHAQDIVSNNILTPSTDAWSGSVTGEAGGYTGGGSGPAYNPNTNTLIFGYTTGTATQRITAEMFAIQHALDLSNSGIKINGYNYSWLIDNSGQQSGTLSGQVNLLRGNIILRTDNYNYDAPTNYFQLFSGTQTFSNPESLLAGDSLTLSFTGKDNRFWAGFYGPRVRSPSITLNYTTDPCLSNPTYSPSCPGYAEAYKQMQCSANPLYDMTCPGYTVAYQTQQCSISALYSPSCPGYAAAYLAQQCSANPLYSTTCNGYAQAYFNQQCSLNGLYDRTCPNYSEAYATKMVLEKQGIASTVATAGVIAQSAPKESTTTASTSLSSDGSVSVGVSKTGDSNVDKVIAAPAPTTNSSAAPSAPVQLVQAPPPPPAARNEGGERKAEGGEKKPEGGERKADGGDKPAGGPQQAQGRDTEGARPAPTARQELQARREAAARAEAVAKGKDLANEMGKVDNMEQQKQIQNVVIQAMGFTAGFDTYSHFRMIDNTFYKPVTIYGGTNVDNRNAGRGLFGATDRTHNEMVESQFNLSK